MHLSRINKALLRIYRAFLQGNERDLQTFGETVKIAFDGHLSIFRGYTGLFGGHIVFFYRKMKETFRHSVWLWKRKKSHTENSSSGPCPLFHEGSLLPLRTPSFPFVLPPSPSCSLLLSLARLRAASHDLFTCKMWHDSINTNIWAAAPVHVRYTRGSFANIQGFFTDIQGSFVDI